MALASVSGFDKLFNGKLDMDFEEPSASGDIRMWFDGDAAFEFAPNVADPSTFVKDNFNNSNGPCRMNFLKGTTTLAFIYEPETPQDKGGIVVAVDSRATSGAYIGSATVNKVLICSDEIICTMAGGAADCQFWIRNLARQCKLFELQNKEKISVAAASKLFTNMIYNYKGMGLSIGTMVAGFDKRGPSLYYVDNDGVRLKGTLFSIGSGQYNAYGVLDTDYKRKMTDAYAIDLARKAIMHATYRDIGSGGSCNVYHLTSAGREYIGKSDVSEMMYQHLAEKKREPFVPTF